MLAFNLHLAVTAALLVAIAVGLVLLLRGTGRRNPYQGRDREHDD